MASEVDPTLIELVATATEAHHITDKTDAMGNNACSCDRWWDSADMEGWDEHIAAIAVEALSAAGRLLPPVVSEREEWHVMYVTPERNPRPRTYPNKTEAEMAEELDAARALGMRVESGKRRTVQSFADGSTRTTAWRAAE